VDLGLAVAGLICVALALGHEAVGVAVLPMITEERLSSTVFGPASMTATVLRVTWHLVTVFVSAAGGVLVTFAAADDADPAVVVLRWFAVMWLAATAVALWGVRRRPRNILRLPVPFVWPVIALLCWKASL
jgi:hypothetical protein